MLSASHQRILDRLSDTDLLLDVGGWARPLPRADWVLDLMPYETRGLYGSEDDRGTERFSGDSWVQRDICDREPWPFSDGQFDFAVCSHTLEDIRDPVWVCQELQRVARAGYIEVPSRLEEQTYGMQGPWAGWGHHHWLIDIDGDGIQFVFKHHILHGRAEMQVPTTVHAGLSPEQRVEELWWDGSFSVRERVFLTSEEVDAYLVALVDRHAPGGNTDSAGRRHGLARALSRAVAAARPDRR